MWPSRDPSSARWYCPKGCCAQQCGLGDMVLRRKCVGWLGFLCVSKARGGPLSPERMRSTSPSRHQPPPCRIGVSTAFGDACVEFVCSVMAGHCLAMPWFKGCGNIDVLRMAAGRWEGMLLRTMCGMDHWPMPHMFSILAVETARCIIVGKRLGWHALVSNLAP